MQTVDENPEEGVVEQPEVVEPSEGKPVGPATIVTDEPMIEQFPVHKEDVE